MEHTRKVVVLVCVMIGVVPLTASAGTNLVSRPIGILQLKISEQSQNLVSMPFQPFSNTLDMVLAGQLSGSTNEATADRVLQWDPVKPGYVRALKADFTGDPQIDGRWFSDFSTLTPSALTIDPGTGFFVENRQGSTQAVWLVGRIVLDDTKTLVLCPGLNLIGYPFSSAGSSPTNGAIVPMEINLMEMGRGYWNTARFLDNRSRGHGITLQRVS